MLVLLDLNEINGEILRLENGRTTYSAIEKLALLYTVKNQLEGTEEPEEKIVSRYSMASVPSSDFLRAVENAPLEDVFIILDKHMNEVRMIFPKEYDMIVEKINNL